MNDGLVTLDGEELAATIDVRRGCDIIALVHRATGVDLMFRTPWQDRALAVRAGRAAPTASGSAESWLERYAGGWQTLCPNAGAPRTVNGAPFGYHGEASAATWDLLSWAPAELRLRADLFSVPLRIERTVQLVGASLSVDDLVTNLSDDPLDLDYAHHPAFGGDFLDGPCTIATGARRFVSDAESAVTPAEPGSAHDWPVVAGTAGPIDLRVVPEGADRGVFGWLTDFDDHWASVTNARLGLTARLEWDGALLPHAWFWQELHSTPGWPWYRRARVVAIEPASCTTSGPDRANSLALGPRARVRIPITLTVTTEGTHQ